MTTGDRAARGGRSAWPRRGASFALAAAVAVASCAAIALWLRPAGPAPAPAAAGAAAPAGRPGTASGAADAAAPLPVALPATLAGSNAPRLPLGADGRLARTRAVRDFFDYCLTAQGDLTPAALDVLVRREIAAQLDGSPAQAEALDVWRRYRAYFDALGKLPGDNAVLGDKLDPTAMQFALDQRAALADRTLGEWAGPFFGDEQRRQRHDLERLRIANDASLSPEQKAARLAALDAQLTPGERAQQAALQAQQDAVKKIADLQKAGATPDQMRAQIAQTLGPEAAARAAQLQQDDDAWQSRYRAYAAERDRIAAQGLAPQDRDARIAQLRQQTFTAPGEAIRAASLDRGAGG
ncbi:lipase secretion chaperone [Burkholderia glumae]|uniref:lipase secretion chaperone n=2 Tax=Burkholderia glumae TaxID=337 RepID=UPI000F5E7C81|nr:lipase secretion chaperone [Burkholderia glumae]RQZ72989.1 lipase secretion chaperone [Burkholderia glumae]UVS87264.1 lipase secretion chaperone [Burkholderia glumae]